MPLKPPLFLLTAPLAAACHPPTPPAEQKTKQVLRGCQETERLLGQMKAAEPSFRYDEDGHATISEGLWTALPDEMKDGLIKAIAYQSVCADESLSEQEVTVRSAETNAVLAEQTVTDFDR